MSVIQTIRNRYAKIAGFVIALALVGFIMMDAFSGRFGDFFGRNTSVAKVNGTGIDGKEYAQRVHDYENLYEAFSKGQPLSEDTRTQLRQQALNELVMEQLIKRDAGKLGITVTDAEIKDITTGADPDPAVQQFPYFINQKTGQFDPRGIKEFESEVKKNGSRDPNVAKAGEQWDALKGYVARNRLMQKYTAMVGGSVYMPAFLNNRDERDASQMASLRIVKIPATTVQDAEVPVTDADLNAYMDKHPAMFMNEEAGRSVDYVVFDVKPNSADTAKAKGELEKLSTEFAGTGASGIEAYVNRNSEDRYDSNFVTKARFMNPFADTILKMQTGGVFGPYFDKGAYKLVKVVETRSLPDSVHAKHILVATAGQQNPNGPTDSVAHKRADSILAAINAGANFDSIAVKMSDDQGSKVKGGDLGYFTYGAMVPEFNDMTFNGKPGDMKVVKTQFGYHIVKILDQKNFRNAVRLATISKSLTISDQAEQTAYAKAGQFVDRNKTAEAFDAAVKKDHLNKMSADNVKPYDFALNNINGARELVRLVYEKKIGEVINPVRIGDRYVIAKVSGEQEKGRMKLSASNRPMIEAAVKAEKKLDRIAAKYKGAASIDALAQSAGQQVIQKDSVLANNAFIPMVGYEPKLVGYAFSGKLQPGAMSPAIKGRDAVYFFTVVSRSTIAKPEGGMAQQRKMMAQMQLKNAMSQTLLEQMRKHADVKYEAKNIY